MGSGSAAAVEPVLTGVVLPVPHTTVHALFAAQASRTPAAIALRCGAESLSYASLNTRANQLAHALIAQGVVPGSRVGLLHERSNNLIVAVLAILKAGCAYVPMDADFPDERVHLIAKDAGLSAVVSDAALASRAAATGLTVLRSDDPVHAGNSAANPEETAGPEREVYCIYTSGSTGAPKGTVLFHRGAVNLYHWFNQCFGFDAGTRFIVLSSIAHDITQKGIFGPLLCGGTVVLLESQRYDAGLITETIAREGVTAISFVPTALYGLLDAATEATYRQLASLKVIFPGGEGLHPARIRNWLRNPHNRCQVINTYGPTETTDLTSYHPVQEAELDGEGILPIGKPIANTRLYVLDEQLRPVAAGERGELCIAGALMGGGYIAKPELTAEKFCTLANGEQIYRSGDIVSCAADGVLHYHSRVDHQVKVRGYRIELGEVEAALAKLPQVLQAVVKPYQDASGEGNLAAYFLLEAGATASLEDLRAAAHNSLPAYMVPTSFMVLERFPLNASNKVDRHQLPAPQRQRPALATAYVPASSALEHKLLPYWQAVLGFDAIGVQDPFLELGGSSLKAIQLVGRLSQALGQRIPIAQFFAAPTLAGFARSLETQQTKAVAAWLGTSIRSAEPTLRSHAPHPTSHGQADIAIVGVAIRTAGAEDARAFWQNIAQGVDCLATLSDEQLLAAGVPEASFKDPNYIRRAGVVAGSDCFDHSFFGLSPREAELTDPQQRVLLECAWHAFEDAGIPLDRGNKRIGVFAGVARNSYFMRNLASHAELRENTLDFHTILGNDKDYAATRIAFKLDLRGPALSVQTACSSSGVALHLAAQSLRNSECDAALAGGASIPVPAAGYLPFDGGPLAQDGVLRPFDAKASGMVLTAGVACLVLKRVDDAVAAGDRIYAVIKGSAIANDGAEKAAYTAPSVAGQATTVAAALDAAGVTAESISYVEAHGTGTLLGDPIEVAGLTQAFRRSTQRKGFAAIGSVKANIGHLDAAAAAAGVVKTALALHAAQLPPSIHCDSPNPECGFDDSPFFVNTQLRAWQADGPRRAGVSSAGFGGTNFHAVLEQAPASHAASTASSRTPLLRFSAKTDDALKAQAAACFASAPNALHDAAYTLDVGRSRLPRRGVVLGSAAADASKLIAGSPAHPAPSLVFAFPGQGAQHPNMGLALYQQEPVFRAAVDDCASILQPLLGLDLRSVLYPAAADVNEAAETLKATQLAQPAIFTISYATAKLWQSLGLEPEAMIGHSVGEYVAATLAGVFTLEAALTVLAARARLMQSMPAGGMLAVRLSEAELAAKLPETLAIAGINSPKLCVVSGPHEALTSFTSALQAEGIGTIALHTSHAFHSSMMDAVLAPFTAIVEQQTLSQPKARFISSVSGTWITAEQAMSAGYWAQQLRQAVRFAPGVEELASQPGRVFLEVGPGQNLSTSVRQTIKPNHMAASVASLPHAGTADANAAEHFWEALGRLWLAGVEADAAKLYAGEQRLKVSLPGYPFARTRHWVEALAANPAERVASSDSTVAVTEAAAPAAETAETAESKQELVLKHLLKLMTNLTGIEFSAEEVDKSFLELGLDSLMLTQVAGKLKNEFKVEVKFRQLMEDLTSARALASYLEQHSSGMPGVTATAAKANTVAPPDAASAAPAGPAKVFGAGTRIIKSKTEGLSERQEQSLAALMQRYLAKTGKSKEFAQKHRATLADPRTVSGFRPLVKELVYPIVTPRSEGAYLWDLDGNQYIDITNGFGCVFFGHRPKFVEDAVAAQLKNGWEIGPQTPLAGEVAEYFARFSGLPRVAFCATGSEAVLAAMRTARTVTGRNLIVMHHGDYHGVFDEVIVRGTPSLRSVPAGAGIPQEAVANTLILDYSSEKTLQILKERGDEIAAVIVEPVQSRRPDWQPREYMHEVRRITQDCGAAFIMDEVVTGFRAALGGAQEYFGVQADLASYGKVIGGGLPIGVIAGIPKFMDALDGGYWQFGDDSVPEVGVTYFAGTFVRHPLAMAAALAVCKHLDAHRHLQVETTRRTQKMVDVINTDLIKAGAPLHIAQFTSLFKPEYTTDQTHGDLLFAFLREAGIHVWDARPCFLTTAHTDADCERIIEGFRYAVSKMQEGGWFEGGYTPRQISFESWRSPYSQPLPGARIGRDAQGNPAWFVPHPVSGQWQQVEIR